MHRVRTVALASVMAIDMPAVLCAQQATEMGIRCRAMNIMTHQGMPQSERVAV